MTFHIADEELGDYADGSVGAIRATEIVAHVSSCDACRRTLKQLADLKASLAALPLDATPERDLLPGIEAGLEPSTIESTKDLALPLGIRTPRSGPVSVTSGARASIRQRAPVARSIQRLAAAILLFVAGAIAGRTWPADSASVAALPSPGTTTATDPLRAAAEVQRTGTAYVEALAELSRVGGDGVARAQGREAAVATLYGAALQIAELANHDPSALSIVQSVTVAHLGANASASSRPGRSPVPF